jgi:hypothetical protein
MKATSWAPANRAGLTMTKDARAVYEGIPIAELLERAYLPLGRQLRGQRLKVYVVVEASDGYGAVFALPEFDPDFESSFSPIVVMAIRFQVRRVLFGLSFPAKSVMPDGCGKS